MYPSKRTSLASARNSWLDCLFIREVDMPSSIDIGPVEGRWTHMLQMGCVGLELNMTKLERMNGVKTLPLPYFKLIDCSHQHRPVAFHIFALWWSLVLSRLFAYSGRNRCPKHLFQPAGFFVRKAPLPPALASPYPHTHFLSTVVGGTSLQISLNSIIFQTMLQSPPFTYQDNPRP